MGIHRSALALPVFLFLLSFFLNASTHAIETRKGFEVDEVMIVKHQRKMYLKSNGRVLREYDVALGKQPNGHKQRRGDGRTPEGVYYIDKRKPDSAYHLALRISYPNVEDIASARARGVDPGGQIMIHGLPNGQGWRGKSHLRKNWTEGCVAVTNEEMEEIWSAVPLGTRVVILP